MNIDYLVVGSGLTGATIARTLADCGASVLVVEKRGHVGGNVFDHVHESGITVHTYGPHYFRTNSEKIWNFVNRFTSFNRYEAILKTLVDGQLEHWPILAKFIEERIGRDWKPDFLGSPTNFEEASLALMPRYVYEKFVKGYTEKQWGVSATSLSTALAKRFEVRLDNDPRLKTHRYQGIPTRGYRNLMSRMLEGIPVLLNFDYVRNPGVFRPRRMTIFTGPIDEFFGFELGRLVYRGQRREEIYLPDTDWYQDCGQVNVPNPEDGEHVRTLEWKHMMDPLHAHRIRGTVITREYPITPVTSEAFEYPFPDDTNDRLYRKYRSRADALPNVLICGRLGEYKYYDMDQAIGRALTLVQRIVSATSLHEAADKVRELIHFQHELVDQEDSIPTVSTER